MKDFFLLSFKNLRRRKLRSWLTMIGIFIGIAAVVSLISLGDGLRTAITGQFASLSPDVLVIQNAGTGFGPPGSTSIRKLTSHDVDVIEKVGNIKIVIPRLIRVAKVEYNKNIEFRYGASMPENKENLQIIYDTAKMEVLQGRLLNENDRGKIVVGSEFANDKNFEKDIRVGARIQIQGKDFEIVGILKPASSFQINSVFLMMDSDMKELLKIGDEWDIIVAKVSDMKETENVAEDVKRALRRDRNEKVGEEDFSVQTPIQALQSVNTILNIINLVIVGIASISLIIGGIGIANTMYTSVLERTKEIGTMKAIGARNSDILIIFLIESGLLGLIGGLIGTLAGLGLAFSVSSIATQAFGEQIIKVQISQFLVTASILFSSGIGILSGILPAIQASKLSPAEALRS
jgi:putative ABC transport system permease protein